MKLRYFCFWMVVCGLTLLFRPDAGIAAVKNAALMAGDRHTLAIQKDGSLWAWGENNAYGKLGLGLVDNNAHPNPARLVGTGWVASAAGTDFSLGLKADGSLWAWGWDSDQYSPH
jgi:alpha-tubulin suppressor-like RCC1 family protein